MVPKAAWNKWPHRLSRHDRETIAWHKRPHRLSRHGLEDRMTTQAASTMVGKDSFGWVFKSSIQDKVLIDTMDTSTIPPR